ncbi:hypothetical protein ACIBCM_10540 [Streptomyces sp. NPDC051018]|uniref:hypothetical protein n=1 Tax=Streptomyces sp. NPDC051018 TaxID=3365639 RepID=UPI00378920F2
MNKLIETTGGLLVLLGVTGVLRELTGWFHFMGFTRFLTENISFMKEHGLFTNIVIAVAGVALVLTAGARR